MNKINSTRITEAQLKQLVYEAYQRLLKEDGITAGSAAANASGFANGTPSSQVNVTFDANAFKTSDGDDSDVQRKDIYNVKGNGKSSKQPSKKDFFAPAMKRGGSISMNRIGESYMRVKVGDLREASETKQEFKPVVFGDKESEKINKSAYADITKETSKYDGGLVKGDKKSGISSFDEPNGGRGMQDLQYDNISQPFSDNVKAQIRGYANKQAEKEHGSEQPGNATHEGNKEIAKKAATHADAVKSGMTKASEIGLTGREIADKEYDKLHKNVFEEGKKKLTVISFKREKFINESHMKSRIPDEYKKEGKKFVMKDNAGNEYLVEWTNSEPIVTKKTNMNLVNEEKNRMRELWGYKPAEHDTKTTNASRLQEGDDQYRAMMDRARKLWSK